MDLFNRPEPLPSNNHSGSSMKELVENMTKAVVNDPDAVIVQVIEDEKGTTFNLIVAADDVGRVIGRRGRVANAMRTILRAVAGKEGKRVFLKIDADTRDQIE